MSVIPAFVFAVLLGTCSVGGLEEQTCDVSKRSYVIQPDAQAYIGVVMAMHESAKSMYGCGAALDTMKTYEAMRWALGRINQNSGHLNGEAVSESYIPGVKIGLQVHDSCSRPEVGTEALFDIVPNMAAQERWCHTNRSKLFLGVIGDVTSDTTAAMADLLGKYKVAQVSFAASAPSFRNRAKYPYLLRTVRPAIDEARAMARVAVALNWTYVAVVHTDSMTGMEGFTEFVAAAKEAGVCVTLVRQINETGTTRFTIQETINDILQTGVTGVVYFGEFQGASSLFAAVDRVTREANLQWLVGSSVGNRDSLGLRQAQARGVIAVTPASTRIAEFEDHWAGLNENNLPPDSPWYAEWYMTIRRCRLNGVNYLPFSSYVPCSQLAPSESRKNYKQFYQVESAILAVFSYAKALKMAHAGLCGENYRGMCDSLVRYSLQDFYRNYLQVLNFTFTKADRVPTFVTKRAAFTRQGELATTANFDVWSFSNAHGGYTFTKVGTSTPAHAMLDLDSVLFYNKFRTAILREHPASVCPNGTCTRCLAPPSGSKTVDHIYSAGDVLVTGMFPVQDAGEMAHVCGKVTATGAQYAAAFLYAIERVANLGILSSQVTLGGFAFSDCSRDDVARNILTNLATGSLRLTDGSGTSVDQSDIQALVTLAQNATGVSDIPVLGAWSRSTSVTRAPPVARIIPSSEKQMRALVLTLKRLQWKTIQLVHAGDDSGSYLATQFKVMAAKEGICAAVVHTLDGGMTYTEIATDIKRHRQLTGVVILADVPQYRALMRAFNQVSDIMFVVSLERGELSNVEITDGLRQDVIDSSIMVNLKAAPSIEQFKEFLRTRSASFYTDNPWFQEWYETAMNCYLDDANQKSYTAKCKEEPITMNQSPDVIHIINAVEAIARGLDATLQYYCGATYTTVCTHYRNSPDHNQRLFDNILQANFYDQAGRHFRFVDRQADLPFEIVSVQSGRFVELGTYSPGFDTINMNMAQTRIPTCPGSCAECDYVYDNSQGEVQQNADILIGGIFDIHSAATSPLSCGDVSTDGYPYLEGLKFALDRVNSGEAPVRKLPGVTVGTVAFDACSSDLRAADKVTEYHADIIGNDRNSAVVKNIKHLVAWVTQVSTSATLEVGDVTRELGRPHLGITTGSANLTDRSRMSTFFNLQGTDDKVAQAIIRFVAEMGWKYVQVVHENSEWGRGGLEVLRAAGISRGVCVVTSYELQTHGTPHDIVTKLQASPAELVITFLNVTDISHMLQAKQSISGDADHLVFVVYDRYGELNVLQNNTKSAGANMLVFRPDIAPVPDFEAVLSRRNPNGNKSTVWFKEYYERMYRCNLKNSFHYEKDCQTLKPVTEAPDYHRNIMMRNVMNAVYAITTALDSLLRDRCGWSYSGVCDAFWEGDVYGQLIKKLERADFTDENGVKFKFTDRQYLQGYSIYQYTEGGQSRKVATYKGSALRMVVNGLSDEYKTTTSTCGSSCAQCQYTGGKVEQFEYIDGDIIIGSVFNMHLAGSSAFTCGDINPHQGVQLMEAFKYALDDINSHKGIFKGILTGVTLGGLSLDACESATRAGNLLANLHSGYQSLATPSGRIDPANIAAYVGAMDSDTSKQMARVLNVVRVPQISYGATSIELSDPVSYPYFLRTVPGDDKQARAMIALLARFGVKYVQVVFSPSSYGTQGAAEFTRQAKARGICVAQNMTFDPSVTADVIVTRMLKKLSASVVIVFLDVRHIKPFLQAVQRNSRALGHFHFIGSEVWAISRDALKETGDAAAGAIYLGVETADLKQFDAFLVEKRLGSSVNNAWFDEYFQLLYRCHLPGSSSLQEKYPDECSEAAIKNGAVRASTYQQDPYVLYTVNAVYAAALGVDAALRNLCGNNYTEVCPNYRSSSTRSQLTLDGIRAASFRDATMQEFVYNDKGESSRGYHIYATKKSSGGAFNYYTNNIGSYNDTHLLKITTEFDVNWVSNCKGKDACSECPLIGKHQSHYMQQQSPEAQRADDINVIGLFDVHAASADALQCGPLNTNTGFYNLLAFFYAINQVNANTTKYHGVKLGATAIDTCGSTISVTANVFSILSGKDRDWVSPASVVAYVVGGGSRNSEAATQLLSPRRITTISPTATAVSLSSAPYFLRTVLPNDVQAAAMADITASMNWIYFSMVSSDNDYSKAATTAFLQAVRARNNQTTELPLCMANHFILRANATDEEAKELIKKLDATSGSRVVVLFTSPDDTHRLLLAAKSKGLMGRFVFLGSEQWGNNSLVVDNVDKVARGAITLQAVSGVSKGFRHYVSTLTVGQHGNIPDDWFDEFWQRLHKCRLENATVVLTEFTRVCSLGLRISEDMVDSPASVLQTIIATQQVALGLANINECRSSSKSLAECISTLPNRNELIYKRIKGAVWVAPSDELVDNAQMTFNFTEEGHGNHGYNIYNYQKDDASYSYKKIGDYKVSLHLDHKQYKSYEKDGTVNPALLSQCPLGQTCSCVNNTGINGRTKAETPIIEEVKLADLNSNFSELWGIILTVLTIIGILVTLFMFVYLLIFYPIKGGTSVLGFLLLFGVMLIYIDNFAFLLRPTDDVCAVRRFSLGVVYALCFACMLIKVLNTWSIESYVDYYAEPVYHRLAHPLSLFLLALAITAVQVGFATEWLILSPARYETVTYHDALVARCAPEPTHYAKLIMSCIYVMVLIALTFIFSLVTWDSEENHNESRFVFFVTCFTIVIWIVWTIVATMSEIKYEDPAVIIANLANATIILVLIFVRKMYLLKKYEKDIKEEKRSRMSSFSDKDGEVFHNISYIDDTGHHASTLGGSAVMYHDGSIRGADAAY